MSKFNGPLQMKQKIMSGRIVLIVLLVTVLISKPTNGQELEHPEWGFQDFNADTEYIPAEMSGTAIQTAIEEASANGGGTVLLKAGVIEITTDINLRSNVKLIGELNADSSLAVTIRATKKMEQAVIVARKDLVQNTTVENLIIDGGGFDHHGLSFIYGTDNFLISNCKVINIGFEKVPSHPEAGRSGNPTAINMWSEGDEYTDRFTIKDNYVSSVALHGINVNNGRKYILQDNYIEKAFMGWDASYESIEAEILGNEVVDCTFGAKTHGGVNLVIHDNYHHNLDDAPYYYNGWANNSGTAFVFQGPGVVAIAENNIFSGTTAAKGIAYWDQGTSGITLNNNNTTPSESTTIVKGKTQISSTGYLLKNNYPNPFRYSTRIGFIIPKTEYIHLNVYNLSGKKVATLIDGVVTAGENQVEFDASLLASGTYLCELRGTYISTKQMLCLK